MAWFSSAVARATTLKSPVYLLPAAAELPAVDTGAEPELVLLPLPQAASASAAPAAPAPSRNRRRATDLGVPCCCAICSANSPAFAYMVGNGSRGVHRPDPWSCWPVRPR